jgi:hypothetical protein
MKKINSGFGSEIEISEDFEVDPESLLGNSEPQKLKNISKESTEDLSKNIIFCLLTLNNEVNISAVFDKISFINSNTKKLSVFILKNNIKEIMSSPDIFVKKIILYIEGQEVKLSFEKEIKTIKLKSFGEHIKWTMYIQ